MIVSQWAIAGLYLYAFLLGLALGLLYDAFRISRIFLGEHFSQKTSNRLRSIKLPLIGHLREYKKSKAIGIVVFIEDFLFCLIASFAFILLFYEICNGKIRFPAFLLAGAGFFVYRVTLGRLVLWFSEVIAFFMECATRYALFFLLLPFRLLYRISGKLIQKVIVWIRSRFGKRARLKFTKKEFLKMQKSGFDQLFSFENQKGKERRYAKGKKKAVQSESVGSGVSGGDHRRFSRGIRQ